MEGEEAEGGEVGERADEVAFPSAVVVGTRDAVGVEGGRRDVGRIAEMRI